ncbi:hypothetical protein AOLI_G00238370 [Acnodon oligacanthus]
MPSPLKNRTCRRVIKEAGSLFDSEPKYLTSTQAWKKASFFNQARSKVAQLRDASKSSQKSHSSSDTDSSKSNSSRTSSQENDTHLRRYKSSRVVRKRSSTQSISMQTTRDQKIQPDSTDLPQTPSSPHNPYIHPDQHAHRNIPECSMHEWMPQQLFPLDTQQKFDPLPRVDKASEQPFKEEKTNDGLKFDEMDFILSHQQEDSILWKVSDSEEMESELESEKMPNPGIYVSAGSVTVTVTLLTAVDMSEIVPPEVRPKPAVPAKPSHVAPPASVPHMPPHGPGAGSQGSGGGSTLLGYVGIDTIIEQMRKKTMKTGFDFNIMVVGQSGLGKSTLVNTLFKSQVSRRSSGWSRDDKIPKTVEIKSVSHVIEEGGVKMKLTVIDTPGFGDQINNENCWEPISKYINEQYEKFLKEEVNIARKKRIPDTRVHCCLYFISPTGHSLRQLDIEFMKHLSRTVNIIPVIAKADTLTPEEKTEFKQRVRKELEVCGIEFYPQKEFDEDLEDKSDNDKIREAMPFAVVGSDKEYQVNGKRVLGRKTAWGIVEVENPNHCEFSLLRDFLIRSHLQDLKEVTHNIHYETYRAKRLNDNGGLHPISSSSDTQESNLLRHSRTVCTVSLTVRSCDRLSLIPSPPPRVDDSRRKLRARSPTSKTNRIAECKQNSDVALTPVYCHVSPSAGENARSTGRSKPWVLPISIQHST